MRAWLAVVRFELERGWLVLVAGAVAGLAALAAPAVWADVASAPADVRAATAGILALCLLLLGSALLGARALTGGLVGRGDELLLARPIGELALWSARLAAAVSLAVAAAAVAVAPAGGTEATGALAVRALLRGPGWAIAAVATGVLAACGAAVARGLASARSPWLVAVSAAGWLWWRAWGAGGAALLVLARASLEPAQVRLLALGAWAGLAVPLVAATAAAAVRGRSDLGRWARTAGAVTAAGWVLAAAATALWGAAASAPTPASVTRIAVVRPTAVSHWVVLDTVARRAGIETYPRFAVDLERGRWYRLELAGGPWALPPAIASGGRYLAVSGVRGAVTAGTVEVFELGDGVVRRTAAVPTWGTPAALSADGRLLAVALPEAGPRPRRYQVLRTGDGSAVREVARPEGWVLLPRLDGDGTLHVLLRSRGEPYVTRELISPSGETGWREVWHAPGRVSGLAEGGTVVAVSRPGEDGSREVSVRRVADGAELWRAVVPRSPCPSAGPWDCVALHLAGSDRLLVAVLPPGGHGELSLHTPGGRAWRVQLPERPAWIAWGGAPSPGTILFSLYRRGDGASTYALELDRGTAVPLGEGADIRLWWWVGSARAPALLIRGRELYRVTPDLELEPVPVR